jgi:hypothetical protein
VSVFLYDFFPVDEPFERTEPRLRELAEEWLSAVARDAFADGVRSRGRASAGSTVTCSSPRWARAAPTSV